MGEWPCTVEGVERVKEYGGFRMDILRAKTIDLFHYSDYTEKQRKNSTKSERDRRWAYRIGLISAQAGFRTYKYLQS